MDKELNKRIKSLQKQLKQLEKKISTQKEVLLTRAQAAEFLSVSLTTLREWTENGLVLGRRIGGRVYYLKSEIIGSMVVIGK